MKFKRISAVLLAFVMCFGLFSTTAFAYVDENAANRQTRKLFRKQNQLQSLSNQ